MKLDFVCFKILLYFYMILLFLNYNVISNKEEYIWKDKWKYYFDNIDQKINEIAEIDCLSSINILPNNTIDIPRDSTILYISTFPIKDDIFEYWYNIPSPKQMRVEPYLCDNVKTRKNPIFNNPGCQLPHYMNPSAPRCQTTYLKWICDNARMDITNISSNTFILPESNHKQTVIPPQPYLLTATNSLVSMCGDVLSSCGLIHTTANCMSTGFKYQGLKFKQSCQLPNQDNIDIEYIKNNTCNSKAPWTGKVEYHEKVFVVAEVDDTYVYHIHVEIMPRILYHLQFLKDNPDIKILYGCDSKKTDSQTESGIKHGLLSIQPLMKLAGLSMDRLIVHQHVYAKEVYLPMEGGCQDPVYNTWQILNMRKLFFNTIGYKEDIIDKNKQKVIVLMKRSSRAKHTRNNHDLVRQWSEDFTVRLLNQMSEYFRDYKVVLFSDQNVTMMSCHPCQMDSFQQTDVLIGIHGAGLSNMLYMKPNSAVIELAPYGNDGRCLLGGGPFSRLAAVMGHNYMIHHPPPEEYIWNTVDRSSEFNISRFIIHINSFLKSIEISK